MGLSSVCCNTSGYPKSGNYLCKHSILPLWIIIGLEWQEAGTYTVGMVLKPPFENTYLSLWNLPCGSWIALASHHHHHYSLPKIFFFFFLASSFSRPGQMYSQILTGFVVLLREWGKDTSTILAGPKLRGHEPWGGGLHRSPHCLLEHEFYTPTKNKQD